MRIKKWFFLCLVACLAFALEASDKKVCLNMIVKDESLVIKRCLQSVKPFIDYWVIVDTGSKDGTQQIIKEFMSDIPGELHEQAWVNFGHNRNEALQLAKGKGDYALFIDADEQLEGALDKNSLSRDIYVASVRISQEPLMTFQRALLVNQRLDWSWHGVIHESLKCAQEHSFELIPNVVLSAEATDGNRAQDPRKHLKDAQVLEAALIDEPDNADYVYYLAQSYYNAKNYPLALKYYKKRAKMAGWDQHIFWSKYISGQLQELLKMEPEVFIESYCDAFHYRPIRAEPIFRLAQHFFQQKNYILGYLLAQFGQTIPVPADIVYVEDWVYSYGLLAIFADCASQIGKKEEALVAYEKISKKADVSEEVRSQAKSICRSLWKSNEKQTGRVVSDNR